MRGVHDTRSDGPKRTVWANFQAVATSLSRSTTHISTYLSAELHISAVQDGQGRLALSGHWKPKRLTSVGCHRRKPRDLVFAL